MRSPLPNVTRHSGWWQYTVTPTIDQALHQFWTFLLIWTLLRNLTFYPIARDFQRTFATGVAYQERTLIPSGHLVLSHYGFCICSSIRNHTTYLSRFPNMTYLPNFTILNWSGFNRIYATVVECWQGMLTPPYTWSCPTLGLASVLMLRPISPELVLFLDFWVSNIPLYFCFSFKCVSFWLHIVCAKWYGWDPVNRFNHISWVAVVTSADCRKSVCNRFVIEVFCGVKFLCCHIAFWIFCGCRGFRHRTESDIFLFLYK